MHEIVAGVHASPPERLPFDRTIAIRAYLLRRARGNLLVHSAPTLVDQAGPIAELGGIARQYLGHWHEAAFGGEAIAAPVYCHELERPRVAESRPVAATFAERHRVDDDFEAIPIPGHTPGSTAFLWETGPHRCLFPGDTLYLRDGEWVAGFLPGSSDRDALIASLDVLAGLDFDVLIPWPATHGGPGHATTGKGDARRRIGAILDRLRRGADH